MAPDRLFAISTAYVTFETQLQITSRGTAGIVFHPLQTADFLSIVRDTEEVVKATASDAATTVESSNDPYGYRWLILRGKDFDQLVVGINAVSSSLEWAATETACWRRVLVRGRAGAADLLDLQLQARLVLSVRPRGGNGRAGRVCGGR